MKILYDNQIFDQQKFGGVSLYFSSLLKEAGSDNVVFPYDYTDNYHLKEALINREFMSHKEFMSKVEVKGFWRVQNFINQFSCFSTKSQNDNRFNEEFKKGNFDIYHQTCHQPTKNSIVGKKHVITVYDMIHEKLPQYFPEYNSVHKKEVCNRADKIIAISETTKKDLIEIFQIPEDKVDVVYLGFDALKEAQTSLTDVSKLNVIFQKPVIFYNGSRALYKNFDNFIQAIAPLVDKYDVNILCSGKSFNKDELDQFKNLKIEANIFVSFLSDQELKYVYENAYFFIFPSLYEGFGIPLTEAMVYNCPMLLSDTPCLKEVAAESALYFNPYSIDDIREKMDYAFENPTELKLLTEKGKERYTKFGSWEKVYKNTKRVYESL